MSYCRWSSDDFQSSVYVYEDVSGGWTTHVANRKHVPRVPLPEPVPFPEKGDKEGFERWFERSMKVGEIISQQSDLVDLNLPHCGETFNDPTPGACADRLEQLQKLGHHVPDRAIKALREEQAELDRQQE